MDASGIDVSAIMDTVDPICLMWRHTHLAEVGGGSCSSRLIARVRPFHQGPDANRRTASQGVIMVRRSILAVVACGTLTAFLRAQAPTPRVHRLVASPSTVAYGYYWADARPVL